MDTYMAKPATVERKWYVVDATGKTLGRLASQIAAILRGKNKPEFTPHVDCGDYVIVINCEKIAVTGKKETDKVYVSYSGYVSGRKERSLQVMRQRKPEFIITHAVKGMLPKQALGRQMLKKLKVYAGPDHKHEAQQPQVLDL